jgi:hypothetical protein
MRRTESGICQELGYLSRQGRPVSPLCRLLPSQAQQFLTRLETLIVRLGHA